MGQHAQSSPYLNQGQCLEEFTLLAENRSHDELIALAKRLTKTDLKCLFGDAEKLGAPNLSFFQPQAGSPGTRAMARIFGKNSMPFLNTFEKHVFSTVNPEGVGYGNHFFGYNFHRHMGLTGPGFFKVSQLEQVVLIDFTTDFQQELFEEDLASVEGIRVSLIKNNNANLFFGGETKDYCRRLLYDEDNQRDIAVVCEGYRSFFGHRTAFIWDILIRQW